MLASEAKLIAKEWAMGYLQSIPRAVGALFAGSINDKPDDARWTVSSDVDIYFYQNGETTPRQPKLPYRGLIMEPSHHGAEHLTDLERLLSDHHQATHFARGQIISDPTGILRQTHQRVATAFTEIPWIQKRMHWAFDNATSKLTSCINGNAECEILPLISFSLGIRNLAALPAIAALRNPTFRRCAVVSRDVLAQHGYGQLHEEMLNILGSKYATPGLVQSHLLPMIEVFRRAVAVSKTPFFFRFQLEYAAEPLFQQGVQEMIDAGDHREAMWFILFIYAFCGQAIAFDGSEHDRRLFQRMFQDTSGSVGGQTLADIQERSRRSLAFLPAMLKACGTIALTETRRHGDGRECDHSTITSR